MIIDGRTIANQILEDLAQRVHEIEKTKHIRPHLAVVRVGDDPESSSYIAQKEKFAKQIGASVSVYNHPSDVTEKQLLKSIDFLQTKGDIDGIILQLPLPKHLDPEKLLLHIDPAKDVDGFHPDSKFIVPIAAAVLKILLFVQSKLDPDKNFKQWLGDQNIVVIGKGKTGGEPVTKYLQTMGADVHVIDSQTKKPEELTQQADIIISAVGKPDILYNSMIKKDAVLIGIGMHRGEDGKFYGDYNEKDIAAKASWYTPVPGGVGPVNVAELLENLIIASENV